MEKIRPIRIGLGRAVSRIVISACVALMVVYQARTPPVCMFSLGFAMFLCLLGLVLNGGLIVSTLLIPWLENHSALPDNDALDSTEQLTDRLERLNQQQWSMEAAIFLLYRARASGWGEGWTRFAGWSAVIYLALAVGMSAWNTCQGKG